jgi:hypothetical protein
MRLKDEPIFLKKCVCFKAILSDSDSGQKMDMLSVKYEKSVQFYHITCFEYVS